MKEFKIYTIGILLFIAAMISTSCKESFLEITDTESISPTQFPKTLANVEAIVASVYGIQHEWFFLGNYWHGYGIFCLDHTADQVFRQDETWNGIHTGRALASDQKVTNQWNVLNRGVYYANVALNGIEEYRKIAPSSEKQRLEFLEGETLFLRGFYMWHMQVFYGQPNLDGMGIPVVRQLPKDLASMSVPRETTRDSYQAMINDFKRASVLLKGQSEKSKATEWSAKAALAKTYLFAEKNDSARIYLEDCINNSGKSLVSFEAYKNMFNGDPKYEYNSESFFETGNKADKSSWPFGNPNVGTSISTLYSPFYVASNDDRQTTGFNNQYAHDRNLTRFGYNDKPLLTEIEQVNGKWQMKESYIAKQNERRALAGQQADGPDPRLYVSTLQPMFDSIKVSGKFYKAAQAEFGKWYTLDPTTNQNPNTFYGWCLKKNQYLEGTLPETSYIHGANLYFIRLPDIYLMYAEVMKASNPTLALEYINKVHRRAYGYNPNAASPVDYKSLTDKTKAPADDLLSNNPLLYERWAEFFGEGKWWEDVRRLKLGPQESAFYKSACAGRLIVWRDEHYAMPIHPLEFESNTHPGMKQNPGY